MPVGIIVPSWNTVMSMNVHEWLRPEFRFILPDFHRVRSVEARLHMVEVAPSRGTAAHAKVKAICLLYRASFVKLGIDQEIIKTMEAATKTPARPRLRRS